MSSTRLLVLAVVRFAQPVHGYEVRRELVSWQLEEVSNVKPGSIYSALKTLAREGLLSASEASGDPGRPDRTLYSITGEGEKEFQTLLRKTWWTVEPAVQPLIPGLTTLIAMPRIELIAALESRIENLRSRERQNDFIAAKIGDDATGRDGGIPVHVREVLLFLRAQLKAEIEWSQGLRQRLRSGEYRLAGEGLGPAEGR